eukprot:5279376-Amphidinium_carterae.1
MHYLFGPGERPPPRQKSSMNFYEFEKSGVMFANNLYKHAIDMLNFAVWGRQTERMTTCVRNQCTEGTK